MQRITHPTATLDNRFTEGNAGTGTPATVVTAAFLNGVQEELVSVIAAAGIALNGAVNNQLLAAIRQLTMPIGHMVHLYTITNPATVYGFGTWEAIAVGRMLIGYDAADTDFDTIGETGGAKTVQLTAAQNGPHAHFTAVPLQVNNVAVTASNSVVVKDDAGGDLDYELSGSATAPTVGLTSLSGAGDPHNNLPPFLVCRIWRRTA